MSPSTRTRAVILVAVAVLATLGVAACGGDGGGVLSVEKALDRSGEVSVEGFLVAPEGGQARLCSALLESYPPQCGQPSIVIRGADLRAIAGLTKTNDPSLAQVTWSDAPVTLSGTLSDGVLSLSKA